MLDGIEVHSTYEVTSGKLTLQRSVVLAVKSAAVLELPMVLGDPLPWQAPHLSFGRYWQQCGRRWPRDSYQ